MGGHARIVALPCTGRRAAKKEARPDPLALVRPRIGTSVMAIPQGNARQRKHRRRSASPPSRRPRGQVEERFVEKLEQSPEAQFLRESEEENTRLRDTFDRMAQVTNSLVT